MSAQSSILTPFDIMANHLVEVTSACSPALIQGWLTGYLCSGGRLNPDQWLNEAAMLIEPQDEWSEEFKSHLFSMLDDTLGLLEDSDMPYRLMLPSLEVESIDSFQGRLDSIVQWCEGLVSGFGSSGNIGQQDIDEASQEMLEDIMAISQAELDPEEPDNEDLFDQIEEHLKVSAYGLFFQFNSPPVPSESSPELEGKIDSKDDDPTLH